MGGNGGAVVRAAAAAVVTAKKKKVSPRKLLMQRKAEQVAAEASASLLFHCSGVNCKQWRELKNSLATIQGKSLFQPNLKSSHGTFFADKIASSPGPLCLLYLGEGASQDKLSKLLPPASMSDSMLLLFGQQQSSILNHVDVKKASSLDLVSVYRRSVFSTLFNPMVFFSGLDRMKSITESGSSTTANEEGSSTPPT
ncbi:hypothetical protein L7F22_047823 [Adiantum nelumboides]|nr:hypothetical protein [Adiantum nelumboides]